MKPVPVRTPALAAVRSFVSVGFSFDNSLVHLIECAKSSLKGMHVIGAALLRDAVCSLGTLIDI